MKTNDVRTLVLLVLSLFSATFVRADATAYAQILRERDAVLSGILADRERHAETGLGDPAALTSAKVALWTFRRDTAATKEGKLRQQELIVAEHEKNLATVKARKNAGVSDTLTVLIATDRYLEAKQVLEELQAGQAGR